MTAAIFYHPEAYTVTGKKLMGRNAAGDSFLRGFLNYSQAEQWHVYTQHKQHAEQFLQRARQAGRKEPVVWINHKTMTDLKKAGTLYYPAPTINVHAYQRALFDKKAWSLCGITHTTSSAGAMDEISNLLSSPVQPWDALICTSAAVKQNVETLLDAQKAYLKDTLGATRFVLPQLPVIPLGIDTNEFVFSEEEKLKARESLGIDKAAIVVLYVGRLSFHAKAHPLAMYQALEKAAQEAKKNIVLIECGWFANDYIQKAYANANAFACPHVKVIRLDGREAPSRKSAWASADVFCSLSDNIQETFGITPIEAMASGLPVVVSDWDGYKDTVRDGVDGFRVATMMPEQGVGRDFAIRHALEIDTYDMYCGYTCSLISVDVEKATKAFVALFKSKSLRKKMGDAARLRAVSVYDWKNIIPQYEALWAELESIRIREPADHVLKHPWPARMDPFAGFANYSTKKLRWDTRLALAEHSDVVAIERAEKLLSLEMVDYAKLILPTIEDIKIILNGNYHGKAKTAEQLVANLPANKKHASLRWMAWMIKMGLLVVVDE